MPIENNSDQKLQTPVNATELLCKAQEVFYTVCKFTNNKSDISYYSKLGDGMFILHGALVGLIEAAINVHAACRSNKEPDLIALAEALDALGVKQARKEALNRIQGAV